MSQLPTADAGLRHAAPASRPGGDGTPGGVDTNGSTMLDATDHSAEQTPGPAPKRAIAAEQARMLQIENAALIDGLRALNAQVKQLEAERSHLLEAGSARSQEQELRPPSTNSWASRSRSGELASVHCARRDPQQNANMIRATSMSGYDMDVFPRLAFSDAHPLAGGPHQESARRFSDGAPLRLNLQGLGFGFPASNQVCASCLCTFLSHLRLQLNLSRRHRHESCVPVQLLRELYRHKGLA